MNKSAFDFDALKQHQNSEMFKNFLKKYRYLLRGEHAEWLRFCGLDEMNEEGFESFSEQFPICGNLMDIDTFKMIVIALVSFKKAADFSFMDKIGLEFSDMFYIADHNGSAIKLSEDSAHVFFNLTTNDQTEFVFNSHLKRFEYDLGGENSHSLLREFTKYVSTLASYSHEHIHRHALKEFNRLTADRNR